ncbi:Exosome component 10 [Xylographa soralifera]|nr:Exosome component 10 [Xylographa soralifera]
MNRSACIAVSDVFTGGSTAAYSFTSLHSGANEADMPFRWFETIALEMTSNGQFKSIQDRISASLVSATRTVGQIAAEDLAFHRSSDPAVARKLDEQNSRLLSLARRLTRSAAAGSDVAAPELRDNESVEDNWKGIVDVVDNLLEKADACLDEYTGVIKRLSPSRRSAPAPVTVRKTFASKQKTQDIPKPQLLFNKVPDNQDSTVFKPLLRTKPHAIIPLQESISPIRLEDGFEEYDTRFYLSLKDCGQVMRDLIDTHFRYKHPYEIEILQSSYPPSVYVKSDPLPYSPLESTTATFVDTVEGVEAMLAELRNAKEIAIDLEHHDTHSYVGLVSLMQISTREKDWVVDTLKPWREELQVLNEVFADPSILKVLHGAFMDIIWLQRDLGLYVVGLFDTYHASVSLNYPRHSLAWLLAKFANFDAQKQYQMADWRLRPLPEQMFNYARSDTHFLLNVYDHMRNELIDSSETLYESRNLIETVLEESKKVALRKYEREFYDTKRGMGATGWLTMLNRTPALFTREQFSVFRAVHSWRDEIARRYDESLNFIMPKNVIYNIARGMPVELPALLACSHPISRPMHEHTTELLAVIRDAKAHGHLGPDMKEFMRAQAASFESIQEKEPSTKPQPSPKPRVSQIVPSFSVGQTVTAIRSQSSMFWGPTVNGETEYVAPEQPAQQKAEIRLALPLPPLTADVFAMPNTGNQVGVTAPSGDPGSRAEHKFVKERPVPQNNVFVIKELGGLRKRKATELKDTLEPSPQTTPLDGQEAADHDDDEMEISPTNAVEQADLHAARKAQKKAERAQRKQEKAQARQNGNGNADEAEEPFDYANAPSVLHAKPNKTDRGDARSSFDPYSKSLNAPKGMRKSKREIAGKSFTFKS